MSNNSDLLSIGRQCSHSSCLVVDFLPFKCQHCCKSFCQEHFKVEGHNCDSYDETKYNRVAPNCPLCSTPIAFRPGQDPNIRMDQHLERECSVMTGKNHPASSTPRCARPTCKKLLFSPIQCDNCKERFCAAHRFPGDHDCKSRPQPQLEPEPRKPQPGESARRGMANPSNLLTKFEALTKTKKPASNNTPKSSSSLPPIVRGPAPVSSSSSASSPAKSVPSSSTKPKALPLFNKTDRPSDGTPSTPNSFIGGDHNYDDASILLTTLDSTSTSNIISTDANFNEPSNKPSPAIDPLSRAKAERESRLKAMRVRAQKGLLTEEEKQTLAAEEAAAVNGHKDCLMM